MRFFIFFSFAASNATLENANVASCDTMAVVLSPSHDGITADRIIDCREVQKTASSVTGIIHLDKQEPSTTKLSTDGRISNLTESSEVKNERGPVSETEKDASLDSADKLSRETDDRSLSNPETCNAERHSEVQKTVASGVNQESSRGMEMHAVISDIAADVGDDENASLDVSGGYL